LREAAQKDVPRYEVMDVKNSVNRSYAFIKVYSPYKGKNARKKFLEKILDKTDAIGIVEWWTSGGIIRKPKHHFNCILILKGTNTYEV